ncbi:ribosomal protein L31 [Perkinsela sp. CCAP 1560/4]|nr:ribosomal protein L31 [Perkinsela sp. CCAP 1560/4]KNH09108.1 ribosomal protein L31 [Perkinsela sp. CCAP 1560/4]|eukprot:KNH05339.1 ribosomal protein L31 [Perkinsela sp. CCAP 1560/4]
MVAKTAKRKYLPKVVTVETTVRISRQMTNVTHKKRAPRACKALRDHAKKMLGTSDNRIDAKLNKVVWSNGIKNPPHRIRVRMERKVREAVGEKDKRGMGRCYTVISFVMPKDGTFKGSQTEIIEE